MRHNHKRRAWPGRLASDLHARGLATAPRCVCVCVCVCVRGLGFRV
jgi:hypothetical protein